MSRGEEIGRRIRFARQRLGVTQADLAIAVGVRPQQMHRYEKGSIPSATTLALIARELETSMEWLLSGAEREMTDGLRDFLERSPLGRDTSRVERDVLRSMAFPPGQTPTADLYAKLLIDIRQEWRPSITETTRSQNLDR